MKILLAIDDSPHSQDAVEEVARQSCAKAIRDRRLSMKPPIGEPT